MKSSDLFSHPHQSEFTPTRAVPRNQYRTLCSPTRPNGINPLLCRRPHEWHDGYAALGPARQARARRAIGF